MPVWIKLLITSGIIVAITEVAKKADKFGAILAALPIVTTLAMVWMAIELQGENRTERIAAHSWYTFWYVVPTLPMFLVLPWMLRKGCSAWLSLLAYGVGTALIFWGFAVVMKRFGVDLMP